MKSTGLFLEKDELLYGMTAAVYLAGKEGPEVDAVGNPLVVRFLVHGVQPLTASLFVWPPSPPEEGGVALRLKGLPMEGLRDDVRFMPTEAFSVEEAPVNTEYYVFVAGKLVRGGFWSSIPVVRKDRDGRLSDRYDFKRRPFPLPDGVLLVPHGDVGTARP